MSTSENQWWAGVVEQSTRLEVIAACLRAEGLNCYAIAYEATPCTHIEFANKDSRCRSIVCVASSLRVIKRTKRVQALPEVIDFDLNDPLVFNKIAKCLWEIDTNARD